jgi:adenylate kinase
MPDLPGTGGFDAPVRKDPALTLVSELNLILVGPPGAGKGTQAERLTEDFGLPYFATGNILRDAVAQGTELGRKAKEYMDKGDLVPDDVIIGVILEALANEEASDDDIVKRLSGRRVSKSGRVYHIDFDPPKHPDRCDVDGSPLIQREDDKPETIRKRLAVYHDQTEPLVEYYEARDLLRRFDGTRTPTEVHDHIRATVATLRLEDEL